MSYHDRIMSEYYAWVESWNLAAELETSGYDTEMAEYCQRNPRPTFKAFLEGLRNQ